MKHLLIVVFFGVHLSSLAQNLKIYQKPPVFAGCENEAIEDLSRCFNDKLNSFIFENFQVPSEVADEGYKGAVKVLFEITKNGEMVILHIDAMYSVLKAELERVFEALPRIQPGTYNGEATFYQYSLTIKIPLIDPELLESKTLENKDSLHKKTDLNEVISPEFDAISDKIHPYDGIEYSSQLNIPFTHAYYARFDAGMNGIGTNSHTAAKPFVFEDVVPYYDFKAEKKALQVGAEGWLGRKLWDEHLVQIQAEDYWFTIDPVLDLQLGKDTDADFSTTYNNTRGLYIQGGLGRKLSFSTSVFESQGRFAQYYNQYAESLKAFGVDPAIVPGRGIGKSFKNGGYDYPVAEAYLSYAPTKFMNVQFGHGKNFIGDGYRSLFQSDVAAPQTFLKLNTKFWKIKYTNTWNWLRDVRDAVVEDKAFLTKYMANHYLSWNVSKRLNIGLFESVLWTDTNGRGFDINYLNPVIFFRAIEFESGHASGNALLGASGKYKWNNKVNIYGQFILDEFSLSHVTAGNKSWKNKFGYQLGTKFYDVFQVENLMLQLEYNQVRPYTYSHNTIVNNYAHSNQPMAHLWGANFREFILIGHYHYQRWFADAKFIFGTRGFDFNDGTDNYSYGGDIYRNYNERPYDTNVRIGQGNTTTTFHADVQGGYIINPVSHLKIFTNISYRNFNPEANTATHFKNSTVWFNLGLKTDLFNWYFDY